MQLWLSIIIFVHAPMCVKVTYFTQCALTHIHSLMYARKHRTSTLMLFGSYGLSLFSSIRARKADQLHSMCLSLYIRTLAT